MDFTFIILCKAVPVAKFELNRMVTLNESGVAETSVTFDGNVHLYVVAKSFAAGVAVYVAVLDVPISKHGFVGPVMAIGANGAVFLMVNVLTTVAPHTFETVTVIIPVAYVEANFAFTELPLPVNVINDDDFVHV